MSLYGAFDKTKHFDELDEPLHTQEGTLTPAQRRARCMSNLTSGTTGEIDLVGVAGTGAASASVLVLDTAETSIGAADQLGRIEFQASSEASGTDAVEVSAAIWAEAEGTFTASVNTTAIVFATGASEAAAEKVRITSTGGYKGPGPVIVPDGAAYSVLATNSGIIHAIVDQTATVTLTLPAHSAGLMYEFWYAGAAADAQDWIISCNGSGLFKGGVNHQDSDGETTAPVFANGSSNDVFTVVKPECGTLVKVISDGTNWYINGSVCSITVPAFSDS